MDELRPLQGIRVVDFSWVLAGPLGTRLLASFGAEEIPRNEFHTRLNYALSIEADFNALPQSAPPDEIVAIIRDNIREDLREDEE